MVAVMWWVLGDGVVDAVRGDALATYDDGRGIVFRRAPDAWLEQPPLDLGLSAIDRWWSAGLIVPSTLEDGDRFRVHQLLHEVTTA